MATDLDTWAAEMQAAADRAETEDGDPEPAVPWQQIGTIDVQVIRSGARRGRRLLVVEYGADDEARVLELVRRLT
jgi:hypothetical protein